MEAENQTREIKLNFGTIELKKVGRIQLSMEVAMS